MQRFLLSPQGCEDLQDLVLASPIIPACVHTRLGLLIPRQAAIPLGCLYRSACSGCSTGAIAVCEASVSSPITKLSLNTQRICSA